MSRILALDLGTSSIKLLRLDPDGGMTIDRVPCDRLNVEEWLAIIAANIAEHGDGERISTISVTGQMHGLMTLENGETWGEGIPWHDQRTAEMLPAIRRRIGDSAALATGGPIVAGFQAASLAWIRANDPSRWSRLLEVFLPKDALIYSLTGRHVTDPSDAAGTGLFAPERGTWAWEIIGALRIPRPWLPDIIPSGSLAGRMTGDAASRTGLAAGTPVVIAGGDAAVGAYGAGVSREGNALLMLSSGAQVILPINAWNPDPDGRWYTWPSVAPAANEATRFLRVGTLLNAGITMTWAGQAIADVPIADRPTDIVALPHLIGTREDPAKQGVILGITPDTTPGQIRRAMLEGIAFSIRRKLEEMTSAGAPHAHIRIGGGLARDAAWRQLFADVLGRPVEHIQMHDLSPYGAAVLARAAMGGTIPEDPAAGVQPPDPDVSEAYEPRYARYLQVDNAVAPLFRLKDTSSQKR